MSVERDQNSKIFEWTRAWLEAHHPKRSFCLEVANSTNELAAEKLSDLDVLDSKLFCFLARRQTAGKGRGGNLWLHSDLMISFLWKGDGPVSQINPDELAPLFAYKLKDALKSVWHDLNLEVKKPNDLLLDGKKLAGILLDIKNDNCFILGLGLNVFSHPKNINATDLKSHLDSEITEQDWCKFFSKFSKSVC